MIAAAALLTAPGCDKSGRGEAPVEPAPQADVGPGGAPISAAGNRPPVELIHVESHIHGLDDMMAGVDKVLASWTDEGGSWKARVQAILLSTGYGPGMLDAIDLEGQLAAKVAYPHPGQAHAGPTDATLSVSIPTTDNQALLDSLPGAYRPQPMGDDMWQLIQGELRYLMRATPDSMQVGFEPAQLDQAGALVAQPAQGRRVQVRAWNIPKDDIDPNAVLGGGGDFGRKLGEVVQALEALEAELDFGADRDLQLVGRIEAPFDRLPLEVYGAPLTQASPVASRLPGNAAVYADLSWGDPAPLHRGIDRMVDTTAVPPPFDTVVKDVVQGTHGLLDALAQEVMFATYLDDKRQATMLVAAKLADDERARKGVRALLGAAERALSAHIALVGDDPEYRYKVTYKQDGVGLPGGKADTFKVTVPKYMADDAKPAAALLGRKKQALEVLVFIEDGYGFVAVGAGGRKLLSQIARNLRNAPKAHLESEGGLELARAASGGCSLCVGVDVEQAARVMATLSADSGEGDPAKAEKLLDKVDDIELEGAVALGAAVDGKRGTLALGVSKALMFADRKQTRALEEIVDDYFNARSSPPMPVP